MSIIDIILDFIGYSVVETADRRGGIFGKIFVWAVIILAVAGLIYLINKSEVKIF